MDTKERPYTAAIKAIKEKLKALAVKQRKNKLACRTKRIDADLRKRLLEELGIKYPEWARASVVARKIEITAHLNLYAALRGKPKCHREPEESYEQRAYNETLMALRQELKIE